MYRSSKTSLQFQTTSQTHCCAAKQGLATFQLAFKKIHTPHTHTPRKADEDYCLQHSKAFHHMYHGATIMGADRYLGSRNV